MTLLVAFTVFCLEMSACRSIAPTSTKIEPMSIVIDEIKKNLTQYAAEAAVDPPHGLCYPASDPASRQMAPAMNLYPTKVTLTLRTVHLRENDPSAGLASPVGVIAFDPSYSGAYSRQHSQTLVVPMTVDKAQPDPTAKNTKTAEQDAKWREDYPLAAAMKEFRDELLKVDHTKAPCLRTDANSPMKLQLLFDAVNKSTTGFGLQLVVFKISDKEIVSDEGHQTLDVEFILTPGTMLYQ